MARGRRSERRIRPAENTDIIPAINDPIRDDEALTGEIPAVTDDEADHDIDDEIDEVLSELKRPRTDAEEPNEPDDRLAELRGHVVRIGGYLWQRLAQLVAALLAWLVGQTRTRVPQAGTWLRPRLTRLGASIVAGLLLCSSYPRFDWWWAAIPAFAVLAWVLTRQETTPFGGFGYGFLFGLAFYLPLIRWISILVGAMPLLALVLLCAVFPGLFGLAAVTVRRLPGWPIWFAVLWAAQEWLKCTIPFGGFPWGVVAAGRRPGRSCRWSGSAAFRCCRWRSCSPVAGPLLS